MASQEFRFYAHSLEGDPNADHWHGLEEHLRAVAKMAAEFAEAFQSRDWGYLSGLLHDLGKFQPEFQLKLMGSRISVEHSGIGAVKASELDKDRGIPLAFVVAGHHAGLANLLTGGAGLPSPLKERLRVNKPLMQRIQARVPGDLLDRPLPDFPGFLKARRKDQSAWSRSAEFWIRFLFSALVDADRLDTESFCQPTVSHQRGAYGSMPDLRKRLDAFIDNKVAQLPPEEKRSTLNRVRNEVLNACRVRARDRPGIFSLTAPTGGGKTLSAMSFALRHAESWDLGRVIVVIPYTSIIEQNADAYRLALGYENVVEHHSNLDLTEAKDVHGEEITRRHALACENWDAPVIVTTSVQFFESLFSNHPSRCRKLHNIARSVVVLDEVQTLPPGFLLSILDALNELVCHYGCTVVLSTATQPALASRERFEVGLKDVRELVPDSTQLAEVLKRVNYIWPESNRAIQDWHELAADLAKHQQVLAVVHKRNDARVLARSVQEVLQGESVWHLSGLMCAAHRSDILTTVKAALQTGRQCRLISTQLVEAGVDIDFPVVYRAIGGLDSIVQAAGRCNREGRLAEGRVVIFRSPTEPPRGTPSKGLEVTESILREAGGSLNLNDPRIFETYFRMLYFIENQDLKQIQVLRQEFSFATVAREFRVIEDGFSRAVVVPYGKADQRLEELRKLGPNRECLRGLQVFTVNVFLDAFTNLSDAGALEQVVEGVFVLAHGFKHLYDSQFGLVVGDEPKPDPRALIV